jgi:hypothetical protein
MLTCMVAGRSGEVNGWSNLDAREEYEGTNAHDQVFCAVLTEQLNDLRFGMRDLGLKGKRARGRVRFTNLNLAVSSPSSLSTSR